MARFTNWKKPATGRRWNWFRINISAVELPKINSCISNIRQNVFNYPLCAAHTGGFFVLSYGKNIYMRFSYNTIVLLP